MGMTPAARPAFVLCLLMLLAACMPQARPERAGPAAADRPLTILISVDGLRPAALGKGDTPRLDALAAQGVTGSMRPSFPANTFPNHLSIVTGLRPDQHGFVDNKMRDPTIPGVTFDIRDPKTNRDPQWWSTLEPIWVTAERADIRTGVMFWPGADAEIRGIRPRDWWTYNDANSARQRIDTVLDWARRPLATRPHLILLYFGMVDQRAHNSGFDSPEMLAATREVDRAIGDLVDGLAAMGRRADIIVVSDHGMAPVPPEQARPITEVIDPAIMDAVTEGPLLDIWPKPGKEAETAAHLSRPRPHVTCLPKAQLPERFRFGTHRRVAPWLCMADLGWSFLFNPRPIVKGEHGYDPDLDEMAAIFIAGGPSIAVRKTIPRFDNVHVYPLLARLAGVQPLASEGDQRLVDAVLARP